MVPSVVVAQPRGEHHAERRVVRQLVEHLVADALALVDRDDFLEKVRRDDPAVAERDRALDDQGKGDDGSEEQEPDGPTGGLDDGEQRVPLSLFGLLGRRLYAKAPVAASCAPQQTRVARRH
jgi:hypothetical protein